MSKFLDAIRNSMRVRHYNNQTENLYSFGQTVYFLS